MFLSVVLSCLVLFCSGYVFFVCFISFASYIITSYMDDVRLSHLNKDYLLTYLLTYLLICRNQTIISGFHYCSSQQRPEWLVLSYVDCFSQCETMGLEVILDHLEPHNPRTSRWLCQSSSEEADKIYLKSTSSSNCAMRQNKKKTSCFDCQNEQRLISYLLHLNVRNKETPFDA